MQARKRSSDAISRKRKNPGPTASRSSIPAIPLQESRDQSPSGGGSLAEAPIFCLRQGWPEDRGKLFDDQEARI